MTKNRREVFSESTDNHVWIEGTTKDTDSKVLLTITNQSGEQTALITPDEILSSKASLFVEAPAERVQVKGKSTFARILWDRAGIPFFDADACVHDLLATNADITAAVRREFALPDAPIDRRALGQIVFRDPEARRRLEAILHPAVREKWQSMAAECRGANRHFLADIPLLFETAANNAFDTTIVVAASPAIQRQRLAGRGIEPEIIEGMLASQWPIGQKVSSADHVIWNDGSLAELERQCELLLDALFPTRHE
jgi:dephospho-CoA kinase